MGAVYQYRSDDQGHSKVDGVERGDPGGCVRAFFLTWVSSFPSTIVSHFVSVTRYVLITPIPFLFAMCFTPSGFKLELFSSSFHAIYPNALS